MLHLTRGIVLHQVKYSETSLIVKIFTEQYGLQSYLIRGIRNKKSLVKPALLQPLTIVEMVVYHRLKKDIQHLREIKVAFPYQTIPFDIRKSSVIIFLTEILYKAIREQEPNQNLFEFIYRSMVTFDSMEEGIADFHLGFLMELTRHLGFYPVNNFSEVNLVFDMQEGKFINQVVSSDNQIKQPFSRYISCLLSGHPVKISSPQRALLLEYLIQYYTIHIPGIREIKSRSVLQSVLNN